MINLHFRSNIVCYIVFVSWTTIFTNLRITVACFRASNIQKLLNVCLDELVEQMIQWLTHKDMSLVLRPNVPTYTTPLKYVLFWWIKSTHFWVCSRRVSKLWDTLRHTTASLTDRSVASVTRTLTVNWPVNHLVTVNIFHISFHLTSYLIREKRSSSMICQWRVFHVENSAHIFCIMMHLKANDQMDVYKSSHCCYRWNITRITINTYFLPG